MESIEISAKSVEDAVEQALSELGLERSQVQIEVLNKGRSGILGLGAEDARVRVTPLPSPQPAFPPSAPPAVPGPSAKEVLEKILSLMQVPARVTVIEPGPDTDESSPTLNVEGQDLGALIGRRGETLAALQQVVNLALSRQLKAGVRVNVDVEGYKARRQDALKALALRLADQVKSSGRSMVMEPMPPGERRIVHLALRDHPDGSTRSLGEGEERKVVIFLKKGLLTSER